MKIIQNMKIRHKLIAIIMLTCFVSLLLAGTIFIVYNYSSSRKSMVRNLLTQAEMIAENCKAAVIFDDPKDAEETLQTLHYQPSIVHACLYTIDGNDFASYYRQDAERGANPSRIFEDFSRFENGSFSVFKSIIVNDKNIGSVYLQSDLQPLYSALTRNICMVVSVLLCASLLAYLLSVKLQGVISGPILSLAKTAQKVSENKEYSVRAEKQGNDEIGVLIESFNDMLAKIQKNKLRLVEINESLEEKVKDRTGELTLEVAERRQAEEKLQIFQRFAEESSQGIGWTDVEGNIIYTNPALRKMLEEERLEDMHGKAVTMYYDQETQQKLVEEIFPCVLEKGQWIGELNLQTKNGNSIPTLNNIFLMRDGDGKPLCFANSLADITERKLAEKQHEIYTAELMGAKEQAETANVAKSHFLANMSHEIRTPMNAIIGFSDFLADEDLTDEQRGYIDIIREAGQNLLALINDILDFSKIEAGQLKTEIIDCSLGDVLNSIGSLIGPRAIEKGLEFEIIEAGELPAEIKTDPTRLRQCLINLLGNAVKFTEKGHIHVTVALEEYENKPFVRFDIEDTGIGIPIDKQELIFKSFSQADGSTTRKYGGTGLGLAITRQLIELLGGEITVISQEDKGSVFSFKIPAGVDIARQPFLDRYNIAGATESSSKHAKQPVFSGKALVAEDDPINQILIKSLLERMGFEVTIVKDGNKALEKVLSEKFDMIFMDMMMPNMNGYEATRAIRKEKLTIPIIALTANAIKGDDKKCFKAGCDEYLSKPIDRNKLVKTISKYLPPKEAASIAASSSQDFTA